MNNQAIRNCYDAFDRMNRFGMKHAGRFAANSRATGLFAKVGTLVKAMEDEGVRKISGTATYHGGTSGKQLAADLVREDLRAIRDTARAIALSEDMPEFDDKFSLPRSGAYAVLLVSAKSCLRDATPHKALFMEFEMPADFLDDLASDIALLEKADDGQNVGFSEKVAGTAELSSLSSAGCRLRNQLVPMVRNKFRNEAGILAEWESAIHMVRPPRAANEADKVPA